MISVHLNGALLINHVSLLDFGLVCQCWCEVLEQCGIVLKSAVAAIICRQHRAPYYYGTKKKMCQHTHKFSINGSRSLLSSMAFKTSISIFGPITEINCCLHWETDTTMKTCGHVSRTLCEFHQNLSEPSLNPRSSNFQQRSRTHGRCFQTVAARQKSALNSS